MEVWLDNLSDLGVLQRRSLPQLHRLPKAAKQLVEQRIQTLLGKGVDGGSGGGSTQDSSQHHHRGKKGKEGKMIINFPLQGKQLQTEVKEEGRKTKQQNFLFQDDPFGEAEDSEFDRGNSVAKDDDPFLATEFTEFDDDPFQKLDQRTQQPQQPQQPRQQQKFKGDDFPHDGGDGDDDDDVFSDDPFQNDHHHHHRPKRNEGQTLNSDFGMKGLAEVFDDFDPFGGVEEKSQNDRGILRKASLSDSFSAAEDIFSSPSSSSSSSASPVGEMGKNAPGSPQHHHHHHPSSAEDVFDFDFPQSQQKDKTPTVTGNASFSWKQKVVDRNLEEEEEEMGTEGRAGRDEEAMLEDPFGLDFPPQQEDKSTTALTLWQGGDRKKPSSSSSQKNMFPELDEFFDPLHDSSSAASSAAAAAASGLPFGDNPFEVPEKTSPTYIIGDDVRSLSAQKTKTRQGQEDDPFGNLNVFGP